MKQLTGNARLQFTRKPFSHWSISFIKEPIVDLAIESQIQGRTMQSNVTSLISTAVKKAIRRKHTMPNYKLRFKPFFNRLIYDEEIDMPIEASGSFEVTLRNITRLSFPSHINQVYATLTLSKYAWVTAEQLDDQNLSVSLDIEIHKAKNQQIGIVFKQTEQILIETILPNTPAAVAKVRCGDVLVSIEGRKLNHISQVAKLLKSLNKTVLNIRVQRTVAGVIKNDAIAEDFADVYEDFNTVNISFSKNSESVQIGNESRLGTAEKIKDASSNESSMNNSPSNSPRRINAVKAKSSSETAEKHNLEAHNHFPQHSTIDSSISDFVTMDDTTKFALNPSFLFINVNVFGKSSKGDNMLLGYLNIPIVNVLAECIDSNLHYIDKFMLNPPEVPELSNNPLSTQSGFSSSICYGDVSMGFDWKHDTVKDSTKDKLEEAKVMTKPHSVQGSQDKLDAEAAEVSRKHDFIRTHFSRSTQCGTETH